MTMRLEIRTPSPSLKPMTPVVMSGAGVVYGHLKDVAESDREMFIILMLDTKSRIVKKELISLGTVDTAAVYPREVFKSAILASCASMVLVHNHPSGNCEPSSADRKLTQDLETVAKILGIKILDHIIIGKGSFYSFADHGEIDLQAY